MAKKKHRYHAILEKIFFDRYSDGDTEVHFSRPDLFTAADELEIIMPDNPGDIVYSVRYRIPMPAKVLETQPDGLEWIIEGTARSHYAFRLVTASRIRPREDLKAINIPDATPEIIRGYAQGDEQALLAILRYNRLIDIFLGIATYSLQNHWRSTLSAGVQVEIDEVYVGVDRRGCHYVIPVQAKTGSDQIGVVQTRQDLQLCAEKFPGLAIRAISAQFMDEERIAIFEIELEEDRILIVEERHYRLVPNDEIDDATIRNYKPKN